MKKLSYLGAVAIAATVLAGPIAAQDPTSVPEVTEFLDPIAQEFELDRSERMTVQVRVNGSEPVPFIIDTGAERTVISHDLAARLALEAGPQLTLATITGPEKVKSFYIENLAMTSVNVEGLEAPALERGNMGAYGLIGIDSLEDHRVLLDFKAGKMDVLPSKRSRQKSKLEKGMIVVTAVRRAGRMILSSAKIDGMKIDIILDTGAQSSMGNAALRAKLGRHRRTNGFVPVTMRSVTGDILVGEFTQIRAIEVGGLIMQDLPITFADNYAFKALKLNDRPAILLGMDALRLFDRVMIDFANRRVGFDLPRGAGRTNGYSLALRSTPVWKTDGKDR